MKKTPLKFYGFGLVLGLTLLISACDKKINANDGAIKPKNEESHTRMAEKKDYNAPSGINKSTVGPERGMGTSGYIQSNWRAYICVPIYTSIFDASIQITNF